MCSTGIHRRAPIDACPVHSRTYDRCPVLILFRDAHLGPTRHTSGSLTANPE